MKHIKIFAIGSHTFIERVSGVDFVRILQPMRVLNGYKDDEVEIETKVYSPKEDGSFDWRDIFQEYDAVYFNYTTNDIGYAVMGTLAQKYGRKLIVDVDDDLFNLAQSNPAYEVFKKDSWGRTVVRAVLNDVYHITCTNHHLKNLLMSETIKTSGLITVLPNYIDLELYKHRSPFKDRGYYKAIHFGSSTHQVDLHSEPFYQAMDRVMKEYPNFSFVSVGAFVAKYKNRWGRRYEQGFGATDLLEWITMMPKFMDDADFAVVPLVVNTYNKSKSNIKRWETSSYKIPFIGQRIRQYNEVVTDGVDGYLVETEDEWYKAITTMINDSKKRKEIGEAGFERLVKEAQMKSHVGEYASMFKELLTNT